MTIEFKFTVDDVVLNKLGGKGIVTDCTYSKSGKRYYVVSADNNGQWWDEEHLQASTAGYTHCG